MAQPGRLYSGVLHDRCTTLDESSPLLAHTTPNTLESQDTSIPPKVHSTSKSPLPRAQLICLCLIRLVEPIAFTQIFPYVNEMMAHIHLTNDPSRVGFYSGLAESAFSISSLFSIYHWARLSGRFILSITLAIISNCIEDVIGRRPVIFIGILGVSFATALFGLQRTLPGILLVRSIGQSAFDNPSTSIISLTFIQEVSSLATLRSSIRYWAKLQTPPTKRLRFRSLVLLGQSVLSLGMSFRSPTRPS